MSALLAGLHSTKATLLTPSSEVERGMRNAMVLLVGAACTLVPHFAHLPTWISLAATTLLLIRGWFTLNNRPAPSKWVLIVLAIVAGIAVWRTFGWVFGRDAGGDCLVLLLYDGHGRLMFCTRITPVQLGNKISVHFTFHF